MATRSLDGFGDRLALGGQGLDISFDRRDLRLEAFDERLEIGACVFGPGGGGAIGVGEAIPDEVPSGQDQGLQAQAVAVAGLPEREFGVTLLGVSGQRPGVDGVGFAERSERADEGLDLAGVGAVSRDACGDEGGQEIALIAAGRLADYEAGRVERCGKVEQSAWLVGD